MSMAHTHIYFVAIYDRERFKRQLLYLKHHKITMKSFTV